jgi:Coenzyme PQQ synthesis protein D (PqqD)
MWCGCRPPSESSGSAPQPFSVMDAEVISSETPVPSADAAGPDWSRIMRLVPQQSVSVQGVTLEGETVLFDLATGRSYRLNAVGTAVWEQCTGTATLHQIHHSVSTRLVLPLDHVHAHMMACVMQWSHDGLLRTDGKSR